MIRKAIVHTRELAHGLSPVELERYGLTGALQELAGRSRKMFQIKCRFHRRKFRSVPDPALGIHLYRIAQEAITNAVKHGKAKNVDIILAQKANWLTLTIKDNGVGIDIKQLPMVFELFKRMDNVQDIEGSGVGLAIVKRIVEKHNGKIWADSKLGEGSTFSVSFKK